MPRSIAISLAVAGLLSASCSATLDAQKEPAESAVPSDEPIQMPDGYSLTVPEASFDGDTDVQVSVDAETPTAPWGASSIGTAIRISAGGAQPENPLLLTIDIEQLQADEPELVFFARWDPEFATWIPLQTIYDPGSEQIVVEVDHLSLFGPFEWVGGRIADGLNWTGRQLKGFHDDAVAGVRSARATLVEGANLLGTNVTGWLGLRGAPEPDCGEAEAVALESWQLANSADGDQPPLFGCVKAEADSDEVTLLVANNRPYGMLVGIPDGATVNLVAWPGVSLDSGNAGLYAFYNFLGEYTGLAERYLPPQATIALTINTRNVDRLSVSAVSNPAYAGLDLAVDLVLAIHKVDTGLAVEVANCLLDGATSLVEIMENYDIGNTLDYYDSFVSCALPKAAGAAIKEAYDISKGLLSTVAAAVSSFKDIGADGISNSLTLTRRRVDPVAVVECEAPCTTTEVEVQHPAWGRVTIVTYLRSGQPGGVAAVDTAGMIRWRARIGPDSGLARLGLAGQYQPSYPDTERGVSGPVDSLGHIFIDYDPGRFNGVVVLRPTADGFEDFGSLPTTADDYGGFYYAEVTDSESDGTYEVQAYVQDCTPSCAQGLDYSNTWAWDGQEYVVVASTAPPPGSGPTDHCGSTGEELAIASCVATAYGNAVSSLDRQVAAVIAPGLTDNDWRFFEFGVSLQQVNCVADDSPQSAGCILNFGGVDDWCVSVDVASQTIWKQIYCGP